MVRSGHQKWRKNDENSHWTRMRKIGDGHIGTGKVPETRFLAVPQYFCLELLRRFCTTCSNTTLARKACKRITKLIQVRIHLRNI